MSGFIDTPGNIGDRPVGADSIHAIAAAALTESQMVDRIVSAILDHRLPPGTRLGEDKLAAAFGVSRTRIRPVLVRLAGERLVTLTRNRGATIAEPTEQEAREVFEVRRLIEPRLVALFIAHATAADLQRLRDTISAEESARLAGDARRAIRLSGDFHLQIADGSGHQTLQRILRELVSRTSLVLMTYGAALMSDPVHAGHCGCQEHRGLLEAIRLRDGEEASRRMREHLQLLETRLRFDPPVSEVPDLAQVLGGLAPTSG